MTTALVTGGTKNIGFAIAARLGQDGFSVAVNGRTPAAVEEAVDRLRALGVTADGFVADVTDEASVDRMCARIEDQLGPVGVLVNNAGVRCHGPLTQTSTTDWNRVLDVVLTGSFLTVRRLLPGMMAAGWGRIVNLAGLSGQMGAASRIAVVTAKSGIIGFTKAVALETAPHGITANAISPGFVDTDRSPSLGDRSAAAAHYERGRETPVGRVGQPEDIAELCAFLCSRQAGYITGQTIAANGGTYM
ncbi:SDR family NAD(P)-dependent oxidoreductase [Microbacterium soli]|uniref:3-oxoacyl-[acyl-carrier-protein] reductase n=1 Tax=Microbacterium soli TaxID=446075 RepID=A0ABP7MSV2_9MICO